MNTLRSIPLAAWLAALLFFAHLVLTPVRDWVSVLSGTPVPGVPFELAVLGGFLYVLAYFGAVLLAPILGLAGAISIVMRRLGWAQRRRRAAPSGSLGVASPEKATATAPARPEDDSALLSHSDPEGREAHS